MGNKLAAKIKKASTNGDYDCLLMFSGGKDSSYLLYHLSEELKLRVVTVTLSHAFLPTETLENIQTFANRFAKKHINIDNKELSHSGKHFLESWINEPEAGSLITLCTGCRLGLIKPIVECAKTEKINVVVSGVTPYEPQSKMSLVNYKGKEGKIWFFVGYIRLLLRNPSLLKDIKAIKHQIEEYYYAINKDNIYSKNNLTLMSPFYEDIRYDESMIVDTLKKLNWQKPKSTTNNSYWRSDCNMYAIRHYFYNQLAGYNEMKMYYGDLLEKKLISEEYAQQHTHKHYEKQEVMDLLRSLKLEESSLAKYESFIKNFGNAEVAYPSCGSCKGLAG